MNDFVGELAVRDAGLLVRVGAEGRHVGLTPDALAVNDAVTRAISRIRERVGLVVAVVVAPVITARIIITTIICGHVRRFRATRDKQGDDARAKQRQQRPSPTAFAFAFSYSFHQII